MQSNIDTKKNAHAKSRERFSILEHALVNYLATAIDLTSTSFVASNIP